MKKSRSFRVWALAAVILFLAADIVLVFFALRAPTADTASIDSRLPSPTATVRPSPSPAVPTVAPTSGPSVASPSEGPDLRYIGFTSQGVGFRATKGSCDGAAPTIERTTDGGATWSAVTPTDVTIRQIDSLELVSNSQVNVLARLDPNCTATAVDSFTQGEFWQAYPDRTSSLTPAMLPSSIPLPGVYAIAEKDSGADIAVFGDKSCSGIRIMNVPNASSADGATGLGCLTEVTSPTPLAMAAQGDSLWLWANNDLYTSADNAATWRKVSRS